MHAGISFQISTRYDTCEMSMCTKRAISYRNSTKRKFVKRSCHNTSYTHPASRALVKILYRSPAWRPPTAIVYRDLKTAAILFKRSFKGNRSRMNRDHNDLLQRSRMERSLKGFARRPLIEILYRDVARTPLLESCAETSVEMC